MRATGPGQSLLLLLDVIDILNQRNIPYAIIGALAASFHGIVRASMDADAVISLQTHHPSTDTLLQDFKNAGFKAVRNQADRDDPVAGVISVTDAYSNKVDLLTGIRGMPIQVFKRVVEADFRGARIKIVGVEDFIAMKIFAGSPKDMEDAQGALKVSFKKIDFTLLRSITSGYGKDGLKALESIVKGCG